MRISKAKIYRNEVFLYARAVMEMDIPLETAVKAATENPARSIGIDLARQNAKNNDNSFYDLPLSNILNKYFGNMSMEFGFKEDKVGIFMTKNIEAFLEEYHGYVNGRRIEKLNVF